MKQPRRSCLSVIYQWRNAIFMIGAVLVDSLLTWKVYFYEDEITFFVLGCMFTYIPLTILSIGLCCQPSTHYLQGIPLVNILWILSLNNNKTKIMQIALSVLMSLPQYLLNDTFILSQPWINKLQLLNSYCVIMFCPLLNFSLIMFEEMKHEQAKRHTATLNADSHSLPHQNLVEHSNRKSNVYLYCKVLLSASVVLPLILIELIHFFPVLFEYCYYGHLHARDLLANMILFNIPKFPVAVMAVYIARYHHKNDRRHCTASHSNWCGWYFWMLCGLCLWCIITPLIVSIAIIKSEYSVHRRMLCLAISYIITSYGGMCAWLLISVQPAYYGLGEYTKYCIVVILILIFIDIVILFLVDWYEYYRKGRHTKFMALPYDITEDEDETTTQYDDSDGVDVEKQEIVKLVQHT